MKIVFVLIIAMFMVSCQSSECKRLSKGMTQEQILKSVHVMFDSASEVDGVERFERVQFALKLLECVDDKEIEKQFRGLFHDENNNMYYDR